jgi:phosphoglycolate phosphatase
MPSAHTAALIVADAYLFDIDGTLLNTRDAVHYYAFRNAARDIFGVDATIDGVPVHGNTDIGILRSALTRAGVSPADFEQRLPRLIDHMCDDVQRNAAGMRVEVCPGIPELLARLREAGKLLGVVSGNLEPIGWAKVGAAGLRGFFAFGCFSGRNEERADIFREGIGQVHRRLGPAATVCVIGDTPSDVHAARQASIPIISVATGIFPCEELRALAPDECVSSCSELLDPAPRLS